MTTVERIDGIYEKLNTMPLSSILPMILPLALECNDYTGYCILTFWGMPIGKESSSNNVHRNGMRSVLISEGLTSEQLVNIENNALEDYLKLRTVDKNQILSFSAKEMEDTLKSLNDMMDAISVPDGLAPVDLYFRSEKAAKEKLVVIEKRQMIEQQYAVLQSYLMNKLAEYRRKASLQERRQTMEKSISNSQKVFIIHGHSEAKRRELKELLKDKFGLEPIILSEQPDQGLTIIEKFEKYASDCSYAFALFTPDDIVMNGSNQYFQARPNVIFELGWFYANLGRSRVCILDQASDKSQIFSDLQGVLRMQFNNAVSEKYIEIERELRSVGIIK